MPSSKQRMRGHAAPKPTVDQMLASRERMNRASAEFLKIDLEIALTFVSSARQARDDVRKQRNCRAARKAYDTVVSLVQKVPLREQESQDVERGLSLLKTELKALGETF